MKLKDIPTYAPITGAALSPDGRFVACVTPVFDPATSRRVEKLWVLDVDGGAAWRPAGAPDDAFRGVAFAADGQVVAVRERGPDAELVRFDPRAPDALEVVPGLPAGAVSLTRWGDGVACIGFDAAGTRRAFGWATLDGFCAPLSPERARVGDVAASGRALWWLHAPPWRVGAAPPANTVWRHVDGVNTEVPGPPDNPVGVLAAGRDGGRLALLARPADDALTQPRLWVWDDGAWTRWLADEPGWITGLHADGDDLLVAVDQGIDGRVLRARGPEDVTEALPTDAYLTGPIAARGRLLHLAQDGHVTQHLRLHEAGRSRRLSRFNDRVDALGPRPCERFTWAGRDGLPLEGVLYRPAGDGPHPYVVWLHGGPAEHLQRTFSMPFQVLLAAGVGVLAPNVRGSTGRDDAFLKRPVGDLCGEDVHDVDLAARALIVRGVAHRRRVALMGWSYGATLALAVAAQATWPRAVVAGAPVADWLTVFGARSWPFTTRAYFPGEPWEVPDAYDRASIARRLGRIQAPTLLLHGELDDRVPVSHSRLVFHVLSARGVACDLRLFPGEGHLFHQPWALIEAWGRALAWIERYTGDP